MVNLFDMHAKNMMEAFNDVESIQEHIDNFAISLPHTTYTIKDNAYTVVKHHRDKHFSGKIPGVYLQYDKITGELLYIGKASGKTSGVGVRQARHRSSFDFTIDSESSGEHMRNHMHKRGLTTLVMSEVYFDMSNYPPGLIECYECMLIDKLNPILNKEGK